MCGRKVVTEVHFVLVVSGMYCRMVVRVFRVGMSGCLVSAKCCVGFDRMWCICCNQLLAGAAEAGKDIPLGPDTVVLGLACPWRKGVLEYV